MILSFKSYESLDKEKATLSQFHYKSNNRIKSLRQMYIFFLTIIILLIAIIIILIRYIIILYH